MSARRLFIQALNFSENPKQDLILIASAYVDGIEFQFARPKWTVRNPAMDVTRFYFCESCGKRITEELRHDKKMKGVYCSNCAHKVMTMEFEAVKLEPAPKTEPTPNTPTTGKVAPVAAKVGVGAISSGRHPRLSATPRKSNSAQIAIAAAVVVVLIVGTLFLLPEPNSASTKKEQSRQTATVSPPVPSPIISPPATVPLEKSRANPASPPATTTSGNSDKQPEKQQSIEKTAVTAQSDQPTQELKPLAQPAPTNESGVADKAGAAPKTPEPPAADDVLPEKNEKTEKTVAVDDIRTEKKETSKETTAAAQPAAMLPVITSPTTVYSPLGAPLNYRIKASNNPTSFTAADLPSGLSVSSLGLIAGTPTTAGKYSIKLTATNATGSSNATLKLEILQSSLNEGQNLNVDEKLISPNAHCLLTYQEDGDLVLTDLSTAKSIWSAGTKGQNPGFLAMQKDGNLVLYDPNKSPYWASGTCRKGHFRLVLEDSGRLALYSISNGAVGWSSKK